MSDNDKIREGEFRSWSFPQEKIREWARVFLTDAGYELLPPDYIGFVQPTLHARRKEGERSYEIVGFDAPDMENSPEALAKLAAARATLGQGADYALILPPVNEYLLLEFFRQDRGRWYLAMKDLKIMVWLVNPAEEYVWCITGEPLDKTLLEFFVQGKISADFIIMREINQLLWEDELREMQNERR
ncbi:MAG: hypothetical protein QMD03_07375 [Syntrophales bacterium]|nr:hypothetical protein [Syntrophales bacterium]